MSATSHTEAAPDPRVEIQARLERASNYNLWIADQAKRHVGRRLLDAGCGAGNVTRLMLDRELVVAVDVWPDFVAIARERLGHLDHVEVHQFDLSDAAMVETLRDRRLDSAMCLNVLEHVEHDAAALRNIAALLSPGGVLFLLVPALPFLYGEMDRVDHHFRRYTKRSLRALAAQTPFEVDRSYYMNSPGVISWFLYGRILRRPFVSEASYGLYDKIVPTLSRLERAVRPPLGQSLVAVLRRP